METFFKVTKSKIILGLVVMILNIAAAYYSAIAVVCTTFCPTPNIVQRIFSPTLQPFVVIRLSTEFFEDMTFLPEIIMGVLTFILSGIILLFFWYFIACSLIKLYSLVGRK